MLHTLFVIFKFIFGLGALATLIGIGLGLVWFGLHILLRFTLRDQPAERFPLFRQLFLESSSSRNNA